MGFWARKGLFFSGMIGCLEMFGKLPLWGYWRSYPDHFKDRFVERPSMATEQPRDQYGMAWPSN